MLSWGLQEPMAKKRNTFMEWWLRKWQLILYTVGACTHRTGNGRVDVPALPCSITVEPRCCYWPRR